MPLTQKQTEELKNLLLQERQKIVRGKAKPISGNETMAAGDLVDQSTDLSEREMELELAEHDREKLIEIDDALTRIGDGTYGVCQESGEEIPYVRLKAIPTAKYSVKCQVVVERRRMSAEYNQSES